MVLGNDALRDVVNFSSRVLLTPRDPLRVDLLRPRINLLTPSHPVVYSILVRQSFTCAQIPSDTLS